MVPAQQFARARLERYSPMPDPDPYPHPYPYPYPREIPVRRFVAFPSWRDHAAPV